MLVAENLIKCHAYYRGLSELWKQRKVDPRDRRCRIANRAMRMVFQVVGECGVAEASTANTCSPSCKSFIASTRLPSNKRSAT